MSDPCRLRGFTLVEVVVALLVLEVGILAAAGTMVMATRTLGLAEMRARAATSIESVLDSLDGGASEGTFTRVERDGTLSGFVAADGRVEIQYRSVRGGVLLRLQGAVPIVASATAP